MIWLVLSAAVAANVSWHRIAILACALVFPVPAAVLIAVIWWKTRPSRSMRAAWFCDAVATELRAGASIRHGVETAALSVEAMELAGLCSAGAPMGEVAVAAQRAFPDLGPELEALLASAHRMAVAPAALFDELGSLAMARVEVLHEVSTATAPAKAAAFVLLAVPLIALSFALGRGGLAPYLAQPAQRAAALTGFALTLTGLAVSARMLRRSG